MTKLTYLEAAKVLTEAHNLRTEYHKSGSRLGQSIHWATDPKVSSLGDCLREKLIDVLDYYHATDYDFYHWANDDEIIEKFYEYYVEKQQ